MTFARRAFYIGENHLIFLCLVFFFFVFEAIRKSEWWCVALFFAEKGGGGKMAAALIDFFAPCHIVHLCGMAGLGRMA